MAVRLVVDTGAMTSLVSESMLRTVGYDPTKARESAIVTTGSGVVCSPRLEVRRLVALGCSRRNLKLLCHTLPPSATVDGLLGLDFLRSRRLTIDFRRGTIELR